MLAWSSCRSSLMETTGKSSAIKITSARNVVRCAWCVLERLADHAQPMLSSSDRTNHARLNPNSIETQACTGLDAPLLSHRCLHRYRHAVQDLSKYLFRLLTLLHGRGVAGIH